jgi:transcriptional regulator with XRE-family HTH domain
MPAKLPFITRNATEQLIALGQQIRACRIALRISATAAAEAADMSRITLHRIEKGESSVTMGAYLNAMTALGLSFGLVKPEVPVEPDFSEAREGWLPARICLKEYPQLKQLAWQVHGTETVSPAEAWNIYERNWRHLDEKALKLNERQLIDALRLAFGSGASDV